MVAHDEMRRLAAVRYLPDDPPGTPPFDERLVADGADAERRLSDQVLDLIGRQQRIIQEQEALLRRLRREVKAS